MSTCACGGIGEQALEMESQPLSQTNVFSLPTIHCAACISKVENAVRALPGITQARVNLSLKRLTISGARINKQTVIDRLEREGYEAYSLDALTLGPEEDKEGKALLLKLAVAGFVMMNVMLLSVAVWSGATDATRDMFHFISAALAAPAVIFSAQPFFKNAFRALRVFKMNMDVPISLAILLALILSMFETLNSGEKVYFDAAISLTFFLLIGRYLDYKTRSSARSAAKELSALEPQTAERILNTRVEQVHMTEVRVGDEIMVASGVRVPVDGILLSENGNIDRSLLTGESQIVNILQGQVLQAGEINIGQPLRLRATHVGQDTTLRRIATLVDVAENSRNRYTALADRAAKIYAPLVHLLAFITFLGWMWVTGGDVRYALNIAIAVLIITCPCALGLAVPAVTTASISKLFSNGFLVKHATALERIAEVDHVAFDKTGTLTELNHMSGVIGLSKENKSILLALAQGSAHPISLSIRNSLKDVEPAKIIEVEEVSGSGIRGQWQGQGIALGNGGWLGHDELGTVLKVGDQVFPIDRNERIRVGASEALSGLGALGLSVEILTGDQEGPAQNIAHELGLDEVHAKLSAEDKFVHLEKLEGEGHKTMMIGDGLNDTLSLAGAHASIAPSSALDASRSAADVVILGTSFAKIPLVVKIARANTSISKQNFAVAAIYNLVAIPFAIMGYCTPLMAALAMSTSSIIVVLNAQRVRNIQ